MFSILSVSLISLAVCSVHAGSTPQGGPCSAANNHLDPASHRLLTECNDQSFCLNNICTPKLCVRDEYPLYAFISNLETLCALIRCYLDSTAGTMKQKPSRQCVLMVLFALTKGVVASPSWHSDSHVNSTGMINARLLLMWSIWRVI